MINASDAVLVTGASGFVGGAVVRRLQAAGGSPRAAVRGSVPGDFAGTNIVRGTSLDVDFDWGPALEGCVAVVHSAARVHTMDAVGDDALANFRRINVEGTLRLAGQAAQSGVRRLVFISTIKVNGESTDPGKPFVVDDRPRPADAYAISKYEAEMGLWDIAAKSGMEVVVIRPVLVYGPGVKANFLSMMNLVARGMPLPFGGVDNRRSLVGLDNLADVILTCLHHERAPGRTFFVSDGEDLSTPDLLRRTATALGRRARLIPVPEGILRAAARVVGKAAVAHRLFDSLQVDIGATRRILGWSPPFTVDQQLAATAQWYVDRARGTAA